MSEPIFPGAVSSPCGAGEPPAPSFAQPVVALIEAAEDLDAVTPSLSAEQIDGIECAARSGARMDWTIRYGLYVATAGEAELFSAGSLASFFALWEQAQQIWEATRV